MCQWIGWFCNTVFFWFGNTGADAAIAILLPTVKHFSCNGAVDWSTTCSCCESVLQKMVKVLWLLTVNFEESSGFIAIVLFHQPMPNQNFEATGSTLKKKGGSVKSVERWLQTARVAQSSDVQNGVDFFNGLSHYCNVLGCTYCFYTPTFFSLV